MKRRIIAVTEDEVDDSLDDALHNLKDDFEYVVMGIEHLAKQSSQDAVTAFEILNSIHRNINDTLSAIADATSTNQGGNEV